MAVLSANLSAQLPFLLLPVRIQTKFKQTSQQEIDESLDMGVIRHAKELLVRIYPDQISINRHEAALTASEIEAAKLYWPQALYAADRAAGSAHSLLAWQTLVAKYGAARANWLLQQLVPNDLAELVVQRDAGQPEIVLTYPDVPAAPGWQQPARATCLPDRFVVTLYQRQDDPQEVTDPYIREQLTANTSFPTGTSFDYSKVVDLTTEFLAPPREVIGAPITETMPVGLSPEAMLSGEDEGGELSDTDGLSGDLAWLANFNQAVKQGMALAIALSDAEFTTGFKRLVVLGVRDHDDFHPDRNPTTEANQFATLLQGHFYTDGLELVPQGTPTNNTGDAGAGYSSVEQAEAESTFRTYLQAPLYQPLGAAERFGQADGQRLADALGVEGTAFAHVAHANGTDGHEAMLLNRALWPATYGYFLRERLQPVLGAAAVAEATRQFFVDYVSGRGPLSAFRIGNEPYGVLPTTQYSQWQAPASQGLFGTKLGQILRRLDTTWTERLNQALTYPGPFIESPYAVGAPYQQDFLTIMGQEAASVEFYQRYWVGPNLMDTLAAYAGSTPIFPAIEPGTFRRANQPARFGTSTTTTNPLFEEFRKFFDPGDSLQLYGKAWPHLFDANFQVGYRKVVHTYANASTPEPGVTGAIVDEALLSETAPVAPFAGLASNYLQWLSQRSFDDIRLENFRPAYLDLGLSFPTDFVAPNSLLYRLLRQAVLLRYWEAAVAVLPAGTILQQDAEFFNILASNERARWDWLYYPPGFTMGTGGEAFHQYLKRTHAPLIAYLAWVGELATVPTARLERLLAEHLDLGSHRLDAWKTGQVMTRLAEDRVDHSGLHLGAFGWLENVVPQDQSKAEADGSRYDPDNLGYLHAPTLNHGVAAAVLRQGFKSRQVETDAANPAANRMAVNLSSERVRRALGLLEGIRTGGSLAAMLGQEFEEGLVQATPATQTSYAQHLAAFRRQFPFASEKALLGQPAPVTAPAPEQAEHQVVNGLVLAQMSSPNSYPPYGLPLHISDANNGHDQHQFLEAVRTQVDQLRDTLDALGDLTVGESIYQAVTGNAEQAGAVLENVAKGKFPVAPDIVHTPRAGTALTHRVLLHLPQPAAPEVAAWGSTATPLARAEPGVNHWLAALLGDPQQVAFHYSYARPKLPTAEPVKGVLLLGTADLEPASGLQPIDLLYLVDNDSLQAGSPLDSYLAYVIRETELAKLGQAGNDPARNGQVTIQYDHKQVEALQRLLPLLERLRQLLAPSRAAGPNDLAGPSFSAPGQVTADGATVVEGTEGILNALEQELSALQETLSIALSDIGTGLPTVEQLQALREMLHTLGRYNFAEADRAVAAADADLIAAAQAVWGALGRRLTAVPSAAGEANLLVHYTTWAQALLGASFRLAVPFGLPAEVSAAYPAAYEEASRVPTPLLRAHATNPLVLDEWLQGLAPVRDPLDHLEKVMLLNELLWEDSDTFTPLTLRPLQLSTRTPPAGGEYWLGTSYPATYTPPTDAVSLVQLLSDAYNPAGLQRALWLDEWVEVIPHAQEDTAVVFHYDQPNTEAPQTLLLAVAPQLATTAPTWTWAALLGTVNETLDLAKKRVVEPGSLAYTHLGTLLPALVAPVAKEGVTMTLDYRRVVDSLSLFIEEPLKHTS